MRSATRTITVLCIAITTATTSLAAPESGVASRGLAEARPLSFAVSNYRSVDNRKWIHMNCEYEGLYDESLDCLVATLWDFEQAPRVFSRIEAVRVRSITDGYAVTEQRSAVRVLGFAFISNLVLSNKLTRTGPQSATLDSEIIGSDGSCLSGSANWSFEEYQGPQGKRTRARYSFDSYVEPRFPAQAQIMRAFGEADIGRIMRELGAAAAKRQGRG